MNEFTLPKNPICLWVFKAEKSDDWFVELESEDKSCILRTFRCGEGESTICVNQVRNNAIWFGNIVAEILGVKCVETSSRGL